jgi:hypothetical protein
MPEDVVMTTEQITADLEAGHAEPSSEVPAPDSQEPPASPESSKPEVPVAGEPPAPVTVDPATSTPLTLTDTILVVDPSDGKTKPWGEIKAERMLRADYSRKMHIVGEMRREAEALKLKLEAEAKQAELKAKFASLPKLADDDPYTMHQNAMREQLEALTEQQRLQQQRLEQEAQERMEALRQTELAASRVALAAEEKRLADTYGFKDDLAGEIAVVEREYWHRKQQDPTVTLDSVAKERRALIDKISAAAEKAFKEKHRVGSEAAAPAAPVAGTGTPIPLPGSRGFTDAIAAEMRATFGRR